jgi:hypothetical protein
MFAESRGTLLSNGAITVSPRQQWRHTKIKQLRKAVFTVSTPQLPRHTVTQQLQEKVLSVGSVPRLYHEYQQDMPIKCVCVCVCGGEGKLVSECPLESPPAKRRDQ